MDYDDGYVAYLNGTEIGRGNAGEPGEVLAWDAIWMGGMKRSCTRVEPLTSLNLTQALLVRAPMCWRWKFTTTTSRPQISRRGRFCFWEQVTAYVVFGTPPAWFQEPAADAHDVTFNLNMANENVSPEGRVFGGGRQFGFPGDFPMSDEDGDGIWSITVQVPHGFTGHYTFTNGACQDWSCKENIVGQDCADPDNWNDRLLVNVTTNTSCEHLLQPMHFRRNVCGN